MAKVELTGAIAKEAGKVEENIDSLFKDLFDTVDIIAAEKDKFFDKRNKAAGVRMRKKICSLIFVLRKMRKISSSYTNLISKPASKDKKKK